MKATIAGKQEIAQGTLQVTFALGEPLSFQAGNAAQVTLLNPPYNDAEGRRRYFSINNPPSDNQEIIISTRLRDTAFKKSLVELPLGTEVEIDDFGGSFVLPAETAKPLVFIAGGIGITPFMSMLRHIREQKLDYRITLLYSNPVRAAVAFLPELQDLEKSTANFHLVLTLTDEPEAAGEHRRIDSQFIKDYVPHAGESIFFIAGPPAMNTAMFEAVSALGVPPAQILSEDFSGY